MVPFDEAREDALEDLADADFSADFLAEAGFLDVGFVGLDSAEADVDALERDEPDLDRPPEPLPCALPAAIPLPHQRVARIDCSRSRRGAQGRWD
jgi:hypothetical protein